MQKWPLHLALQVKCTRGMGARDTKGRHQKRGAHALQRGWTAFHVRSSWHRGVQLLPSALASCYINTTSKLGLPSITLLRNQHGKIQVTSKGVSNKPRQQRNTGIWPIEAACRESTTQIRFPSSSMWRVIRAATLCGDLLSILWKQEGHTTQSDIVKRRKLRVPYVRKN